jgi:tetratricopeptide (TPR) repeat protein
MRVRSSRAVSVGTAIILAVTLSACGQLANLRARQSLKDANALYQSANYKEAVAKYEEVIQRDPNINTVVYFYLGNSYDNLYKPSSKGGGPNPDMLTKAIANYKIDIEREQDPKMKKLSLQYLASAYGSDKLNDPSLAEPVVQQMIQLDPTDTTSYFALERIYEDAGNLDEAEKVLMKAKDSQPKQSVVYQQLAGYYQRQGEFDKLIDAVQQRAVIEPANPEAHYSIASYYWDEAYRDTRLTEAKKREYAQKGLDSADKALQLKPDYIEAIVYKGLLIRIQAGMEKDAKKQLDLLKQATALQEKAADIKNKQASGVGP